MDLKPLIVYRGDNGRVRACVIPRVCSPEQGNHEAGRPLYYIPEEYRRFKKILSECMTVHPNFRFYRGSKPSKDIAWYDADVLGRSCTSKWFTHFAHFTYHFSRNVLAATSLFRSQGKATLPRPTCMHPTNNAPVSIPCRNGNIEALKPRVLLSHLILKSPWTPLFLEFLSQGTGKRSGTGVKPPLLHITDLSDVLKKHFGAKRLECYRSLITTPENFDTDRRGHDSILKAAGIEREPKCARKPHIVLYNRWYRASDVSRKILNSTMNELRAELSKATNASVEWIYGMGKYKFSEQVQMMQRADVLVAAHGAELSNTLFLRRDARIIELMPFGGNTYYFRYSLADPIHVKHIAYATKPDPDRFYKCIEKYIASGKMKAPLIEARDIYKKRNAQYGRAKNETQRQKAGLFHVGHGPRQKCIKMQVADFNPPALARLISREASTRCDYGQ